MLRLGTGSATPVPQPGCGGGFYILYHEVGRHWLRGSERTGLGEGDHRPIYLNWRTGECRKVGGRRDIDRPELPRVAAAACGDRRTRHLVGRSSGDSRRPLVVRLCRERRARRIRCATTCAFQWVGAHAIVWTEGWDVVKAERLDDGTRWRWRFADSEHEHEHVGVHAVELGGTIHVGVPRRFSHYRLYAIALPR